MYRYITWFQENYPRLKEEMAACDHNYDHRNLNPYHLESDCWSHTMMVCKMAEINHCDKVVQIAALLHDIGKPSARKVNPRNNHIQFFGHEKLSAQRAEEILLSMREEGMIDRTEKKEIIKLIAHHSFLYLHPDIEDLLDAFDRDLSFCIHLVEVSRCDNQGRFCSDTIDDAIYRNMLDDLHSRQEMEMNRIPAKRHHSKKIYR